MLIAICVFLNGIFLIVRISNDTTQLNLIKASKGTFLLGISYYLYL